MDIGELSSCSSFLPISCDDKEAINHQNSDGNGQEIVVNDQGWTGQLQVSDDSGDNNFEDMIYVGKVFESDTDAYEEYLLYAMRVGFRVRKNKQYLRDDGSVRSRYFVCFREGERRKDKRCHYVRLDSKEHRSREETRTGCKARMALKNMQSKWVVSEIIHEHNHPLTSPSNAVFILPDDKDRKIRELSEEIQQEKRLRTACEKRINQVLKDVEEHTQNLAAKIGVVVNNVKMFESEELDGLDDNNEIRAHL